MDINSIKAVFQAGQSFRDILDILGTDQREDFPVISPVLGQDPGVLTMARIGRTLVQVNPDGEVTLGVHEHHGPEMDAACWQRGVDAARAEVAELNQTAARLRENPTAQRMLAMGAPPELVMQLLGADAAPDTSAMPARALPPVTIPGQVRSVTIGDPTERDPGFYL